jgi:arylsulfatase A-like enzyme
MNPSQPNVLFLMCDQMQGRVLQKSSACLTPNFDKLADSGVRFDCAYTPNAVCSPARASLMTGLLPHNHGVLQVTHTTDPDQNVLRTEKPHWAQRLQEAGYRTGYFGKWHVERTNELKPFGWEVNGEMSGELFTNGRKRLLGDAKKGKGNFTKAKYNEAPPGYSKTLLYAVTDQPPERRGVGIVTRLAGEYLDEVSGGSDPWCCFVSVTEPHDPFIAGEEAYSLYDVDALELQPNVYDDLKGRPGLYRQAAKIWGNLTEQERKEAMACYYASITEIDSLFGNLIDKLRDNGQLENTIIVLTSDHGELLGTRGLYTKNISAAEEVYNIPMVVSGPGISQGVVSTARIGLHDLCPTLLELTGCSPFTAPDSRSFAAVLNDPAQEANYQTGYAEYHGGRILISQRVVWDRSWKLVFNGFDESELYDLASDPFEMNNLINAEEHQGRLESLFRQMWQTMKLTGDHSLYDSHYAILRIAPFGPNI